MRPKKGRFINGVWHCNCDPRLPASHFQVKKDSVNKNRWFYCCTSPKETQCGFFLWDEDAKLREEKTLLGNGRTEMDVADVTPRAPETPRRERMGHTGGWLDDEPQTPVSMQKQAAYPTPGDSRVKKARSPQMTSLLERSSPTYQNGSLSGDDLDTPGSRREGLAVANIMPCKRKADFDFEDNSQKVQKLESSSSSRQMSTTTDLVRPEERNERYTTPSTVRRLDFGTPTTTKISPTSAKIQVSYPPTTPTPSRITSSPNEEGNYDITSFVLSLLRSTAIPESTRQSIQQTLNSFALRASGIERGRDITRVALKKKDGRIAELEQRILQLERERELDKATISHFEDMAESVAATDRAGTGHGNFGKS